MGWEGGLLDDKWPGENAAFCRYLKSLSAVIIGICLRVKDVLHWGNKYII